jgi:hypothetical protein
MAKLLKTTPEEIKPFESLEKIDRKLTTLRNQLRVMNHVIFCESIFSF